MIGHLGKGARGGKADTDRNTHILPDSLDQCRHHSMTGIHILVLQCKKSLINRILLQIVDLRAHELHHTVRQVAVQDVSCRQLNNLTRIGVFLDFEGGATHRDASSLGLVAPGNDTAVVVGEHNDLLSVESRVKQALTGNEEVIAVNQAVHFFS